MSRVIHARATARLTRLFGAAPIVPVVEKRPPRSLFAMAYDNAIEDCVRETFGAVVAQVQARRARSRVVRKPMRSIARDECHHAQLSWAIDSWLHDKLTPQQPKQLASDRQQAVAQLRQETERSWSPSIEHFAGMPKPQAAMRMLEPMTRQLWLGQGHAGGVLEASGHIPAAWTQSAITFTESQCYPAHIGAFATQTRIGLDNGQRPS